MFSPYSFESRGASNSLAGSLKLEGCLLRLEMPDGQVGYSDLRPHRSLGDKSTTEQLRSLKEMCPTALAGRSLFFAKADAQARSLKRSLFSGFESQLPQTHFAAGSLLALSEKTMDQAVSYGFTHVKFKVGSQPVAELARLKSTINELQGKMKIRLDFNDSLNPSQFQDWLSGLNQEELAAIDFIEDPFVFAADDWNSGCPDLLAIDRHLNLETLMAAPDSVAVLKPALMSPESIHFKKSRRVVFTNYMDHPVGECFAIAVAAKFYSSHASEVCGLRTHHLFEANQYSEQIASLGPSLRTSDGHGIGFTELLEAEDWKPL